MNSMETCVRGFSFMSDSPVEIVDLQYIEGGELERAWRSTRRERLKQREQKIWTEFVKENDVLRDVVTDDPYQFLDQLSEPCLKEIMETELQKITKENAEDEARAREQESVQQFYSGTLLGDDNQHTCVVTFADDIDKDECDMFHIFDDEPSGGEEEVMNGSMSPATVREKPAEPDVEESVSPERPISLGKTSSKSSENVSNVIESSIYCAKVKELRMKINEEISTMMITLDRRDILSADPDDIGRMIKRSAEFCMRFNRIYMYQLQRQMHDIKRNNSVSLPFAKHTQFQSQMVRIVSLHQNLLQSFQIFHKSFEQTCCVRESAGALGALLEGARAASLLCAEAPLPRHFTAAAELYHDDLLTSCDKFDEFASEYAIRCEEFLNNFEQLRSPPQPIVYGKKVTKNKVKKRSIGPWVRNNIKNDTEARLSMYSLDTLRLNLNPRPSNSKDNHSSATRKMRGGMNNPGNSSSKRGQSEKTSETPKSQKRCRRPLMRDPHAGRPRAPRPAREADIRTMVEAVDTCTSSHISRECSPQPAPRRKASTPRRAAHTPRSAALQPAIRKRQPTSHAKLTTDVKLEIKSRHPQSPPKQTLKFTHPALTSTRSDHDTGIDSSPMTPVLKIQCAMKKDLDVEDEVKHGECSTRRVASPKKLESPASRNREANVEKREKERIKVANIAPDRCQVTRLLKQLCGGVQGGDAGAENVSGVKNAQLLYVRGTSPRQPSTPQLLRILEETIKKKVPKPMFQKPPSARGTDRYRLTFNIADKTADNLFQYRTKFVQHMLTSALYANSAVGKPWEMIGSVSEQIIDELLIGCMKEMELRDLIQELYKKETC